MSNNDDFKKLESEWYGKLADEGFHDIEQDEKGVPYLRRLSPEQIRAQEEYYTLLRSAVLNPKTKYKSIIDKLIMLRHSEGKGIQDIGADLARLNMPKERKTIRIIIRRYLLAWGIRTFTRAQLNLKDKDE